MSWVDRLKDLIKREIPEQKAARDANNAAEVEAYNQRLIEENMRKTAIRGEATKLEIALMGDETRVTMTKRGSDLPQSGSGALIDRLGATVSGNLDKSHEDIILGRVTDPVRREELKRVGLQSAESYWLDLLAQPTISMTAARLGNQRLREIRHQLNPPDRKTTKP